MHVVLEQVYKQRMIAIVRGLRPEDVIPLAKALDTGGIHMIEVTYQQAKPETWDKTADVISQLAASFQGRVIVGAGTVMTAEQVRMAHAAGACYIVSPDGNPDVIAATKTLGMASFPGALTATEIVQAHRMGADAVKVFPAGVLGPQYIKALKAPLTHIPLLAVGGIDETNVCEYLRAGAIGVGVGGNIVNKDWIATSQWDQITLLAKAYRKAINDFCE